MKGSPADRFGDSSVRGPASGVAASGIGPCLGRGVLLGRGLGECIGMNGGVCHLSQVGSAQGAFPFRPFGSVVVGTLFRGSWFSSLIKCLGGDGRGHLSRKRMHFCSLRPSLN